MDISDFFSVFLFVTSSYPLTQIGELIPTRESQYISRYLLQYSRLLSLLKLSILSKCGPMISISNAILLDHVINLKLRDPYFHMIEKRPQKVCILSKGVSFPDSTIQSFQQSIGIHLHDGYNDGNIQTVGKNCHLQFC